MNEIILIKSIDLELNRIILIWLKLHVRVAVNQF